MLRAVPSTSPSPTLQSSVCLLNGLAGQVAALAESFAPVRARQQRDRVDDVGLNPRVSEPTSDLQMAARIGGRDKLGAGSGDVTDLAAQECLCLIGLGQRVHAGAATAP